MKKIIISLSVFTALFSLSTIAFAADNTDPVITLNGANPLYLKVGEIFIDPGATALDETDGPVRIYIGDDKVNTSVKGQYTISYAASDKAGNSTSVYRIVVVVGSQSVATPRVLGASTFRFSSPLKLGSRGNEVKELQAILNAKGYAVGTPDGIFGSRTKLALQSYQSAQGLYSDGIVGSATRTFLNT